MFASPHLPRVAATWRALLLATALAGVTTTAGGLAAQASAPNEIYVYAGQGELGEYLVGPEGMTLYVHAGDLYTGRSRCHGTCSSAWPPLLLGSGFEVEAGDGVTGPVGVVPRPDGTSMVTYRGRPLYYHARDEVEGDTRGEGLGDAWYVARIDGSIPVAAGASAGDPPSLTLQSANGELGELLTDDKGMTLYFFASDRPGVSTCQDGCTEAWPPVAVADGEGVAAADGVSGVVGLSEGDGVHLVTYDGRPLYRFAGDVAPGDTNGHGVNDVWFVAAVDGSLPTE